MPKFVTRLLTEDGSAMCAIEVPFDPKAVFGKARPPVNVTINGYTYRSTICTMGGCSCIPLRKSNRTAAGIDWDDVHKPYEVQVELDEKPRVVKPPAELVKALRNARLLDVFKTMSFTHQREYAQAVAEAKKPETKERRIVLCVKAMRERAGAQQKMTTAKSKKR